MCSLRALEDHVQIEVDLRASTGNARATKKQP